MSLHDKATYAYIRWKKFRKKRKTAQKKNRHRTTHQLSIHNNLTKILNRCYSPCPRVIDENAHRRNRNGDYTHRETRT